MTSKDKFKNAAKTVGSGLYTAAVVLANSPSKIRIAEIDEEIAKLQAEKAELESRLVTR